MYTSVRTPNEISLKCRISVQTIGRKYIPSNKKSFVLYLCKISLNCIGYTLKNHISIKRWSIRRVRVRRTRGSVPIVPLFWLHKALPNEQYFSDLTHIFSHLHLWFIKLNFMSISCDHLFEIRIKLPHFCLHKRQKLDNRTQRTAEFRVHY